MTEDHPIRSPDRAWIESWRGPRVPVEAGQLFGHQLEVEPDLERSSVEVLTLFLVGSECRFRCTMCDLWKYTLPGDTPAGSVARQVAQGLEIHSLQHGGRASWIKLYNASNFFDRRAIPIDDQSEIAQMVRGFKRVVVENHPKWLTEDILKFRDRLQDRLEVAMGLETVEPQALRFLNKGSNVSDFDHACDWLIGNQVDVRAFVLLQPPLITSEQSLAWAIRSVEHAWERGVRHVSVIPTRMGNGAMERLAEQGLMQVPTAEKLEQVLSRGLNSRPSGILTVDLWNWKGMRGHCDRCCEPRRMRLEQMNWTQRAIPMPQLDCGCPAADDQ